MSALLEIAGLVKRYPLGGHKQLLPWGNRNRHIPHLHAVDDVSFRLEEGASLGLVGESGCGKSTLVRLIARLIDPSAGRILFQGRDIGAVAPGRFGRTPDRSAIQVVFQDSQESLNPRYTAFDCIADPLRRLGGVSGGAALRKRAAELAERVGLPPELLPRFAHQLSGGQKARVNIARAIAVNPKLLILDEPTSALDVSVQARVLQLLAELRRDLGMSYLFVSHDLNVVRLLCDRVVVMYLGKVMESGECEAVFQHPAHPYTEALVSAIPSHDAAHRRERIPLEGDPRSPIDPDPGVCRFYGRCQRGADACAQSGPPLARINPGRQSACHFPSDVPDPAPAMPDQ